MSWCWETEFMYLHNQWDNIWESSDRMRGKGLEPSKDPQHELTTPSIFQKTDPLSIFSSSYWQYHHHQHSCQFWNVNLFLIPQFTLLHSLVSSSSRCLFPPLFPPSWPFLSCNSFIAVSWPTINSTGVKVSIWKYFHCLHLWNNHHNQDILQGVLPPGCPPSRVSSCPFKIPFFPAHPPAPRATTDLSFTLDFHIYVLSAFEFAV